MKEFKLLVGRGMADHPDKTEDVESCLLPETVEKGEPLPFMKLTDRMEFHKVPGVSIAVINDYSVEWAKGYGVREAGDTGPVTAETLFQAASISKPVAAMAALHYVQTGLLDLDEDVNSKLRSWKVPENEFTKTEKVSLRRLLSHSAGLTVHGFRGYAADEKVPTLLQVLNGKKPANSDSIRVDLPPGTQWRYSGGGYVVLQQLLRDVTGKSFPRILSKTVLTPLEMSNSTYEQPLPEGLAPSATLGHRSDGTIILGRWHTYPEMAAAGLWTTPTDLARFAIEVQRAYSGLSEKVLSPDIIKQMLSPQKGPCGLGLVLVGEGEWAAFGHGGANEGFQCNLHAYMNKGQGVVVMTNSDNGFPLIMEICRSIAHVYGWPDFRPMELGQPQQITFHVVPELLTDSDRVYITGNHARLGDWDPGSVALSKQADGSWIGTFSIEEGMHLVYKITRGTWDTEAVSKDGVVPGSSILEVGKDATVNIKVENWKDYSVEGG